MDVSRPFPAADEPFGRPSAARQPPLVSDKVERNRMSERLGDLLDVGGGPVNKWVDDYRIACNGGGIALEFDFELPPGRHEIALRSCPRSESVSPTTSSNSLKMLVPN